MEVHVVVFINFHGQGEFCGVFSTDEKARAYIARFIDQEECFRVDVCDVDAM